MKFEITDNSLENTSADGIVVFLFKNDSTKSFDSLNKLLNNLLLDQVKSEQFKADAGNVLTFFCQNKLLFGKVFVVGLGNKEEFNQSTLRRSMALFAKSIKNKTSALALSAFKVDEISLESEKIAQVIAEGLLLGNYSFNKYQTSREDQGKEFELLIFSEENKNIQLKIKEGIRQAEIYCNAAKIARDLVNEPSSLVNPTFLAKLALDIAKKTPGVRCRVYDREEIEKMGMGAFLGVASASDTPPKFIHLEYSGNSANGKKQKLAIVGKGITFDTGGVSLKREEHMTTMKCDMAGAAAVLGVFSVISQIKPKLNVMGLIAATPNLVSGKSLVPGDVLKAMDGKTIEVLNTDAEGRVTMADSLSYAVKKGATEIIDLATLTGACVVALGEDIAGLFSNNTFLKEKVEKAANEAGEKVWELPMEKKYKELNKSEVADIANIPSTRYGGAITAAWFLKEFVGNKPWVHLDIAGPAFAEKNYDFGPKGGTGFGVRTLLNLLKILN